MRAPICASGQLVKSSDGKSAVVARQHVQAPTVVEAVEIVEHPVPHVLPALFANLLTNRGLMLCGAHTKPMELTPGRADSCLAAAVGSAGGSAGIPFG